MKLSFKNILPILLIFTLLILFAGCFTTPSPTYTVTYDGNTNTGGVVPTDANLYEEGALVTVLANSGSLVKTDYAFDGWNTAANGLGTIQAALSTFIMGTANVTLYAQWTENPAYTPPMPTPTPVAATVVTLAAIPGVTAPVTGVAPVTTAIDSTQYTGTIAWTPADDPFKATTVYTANIVLTAKAGYTLTGVTANFFTVGTATATNAADSGVVAAVFPATAARALTIVEGSGGGDYVTITSNYGDVVTGSTVATITSGGLLTSFQALGDNLEARVTTPFHTKMNTLVLTPTAATDVVTITGTKQAGAMNVDLIVEVRDATFTTITKSFTVNVSGNGTVPIIGLITVP